MLVRPRRFLLFTRFWPVSKVYKFTHIAAYLTLIHGILYFIVKYYMQVESPYGLRAHWSQGIIQGVHILLSPLFIFAFGLLWKDHILVKLKKSKRKRTIGIGLVAICIIMIVSGLGIQTFYQEGIKEFQTWAHLASSALFALFYVIHHIRK